MSTALPVLGPHQRQWIGRCQYPGYQAHWLGTVLAETESEAVAALLDLHARISPHPAPPIVMAIPGALVLRLPGDEATAA